MEMAPNKMQFRTKLPKSNFNLKSEMIFCEVYDSSQNIAMGLLSYINVLTF